MSQEKVYFKERRCFLQNLSFDLEYTQLKDFFKDHCGVTHDPFVQLLQNPEKKKPSGAALVEFQDLEDVEKALRVDGQEHFGRKMMVTKETRDDDCLKRYCQKNGWSMTMDRRGRARIEVGGGQSMQVDSRSDMGQFSVPRNSGSGMNVVTKKKDRRVFFHNIAFDVVWTDLKDYLKDAGTEGGFVEFLRKEDGSGAGGALVDFRSDEEIETALKVDGQEFKGRKMFVNRDPDGFHLGRWCKKHGYDFKMDDHGNKIKLFKSGFSGGNSGGPSGGAAPPPQYAQPAPPVYGGGPTASTPDGKPLIDNIGDLLKNHVFVSNLAYTTTEGFLTKMFAKVAYVKKAEIFKHDEKADEDKRGKSRGLGLIEFDRARDAARAIIMMNGQEIDGRPIRVRDSNDKRDLPGGLSDLGRPLPETQCVDQVRSRGMNPYGECALFMANAPFDMTQQQMLEMFRLVADCKEANLFKKDGRSKGVGVAKFANAYDAQQCINVLNDAMFQGRKLAIRFDNEPRQGGHAPAPTYAQPQPDYIRHEPMPQSNGYSAPPPRFQEQRQPPVQQAPPQQIGATTDAQIDQLAGLLGIDGATLNAIRIMKSAQSAQAAPPAPVEPKRESNYNNYQNRTRDRSPHRDYNNRRNDSRRDDYSRNDSQQAQASVKSENKNWNPITNDTIYIRNLPSSMNENQLRYLFNQCGQISFMDFPVKSDNSPVGYSYIRFDGADCKKSAQSAVDRFNHYNCDGMQLEVGLY